MATALKSLRGGRHTAELTRQGCTLPLNLGCVTTGASHAHDLIGACFVAANSTSSASEGTVKVKLHTITSQATSDFDRRPINFPLTALHDVFFFLSGGKSRPPFRLLSNI